ncbi:terminase small subunit [Staphylococcus pseudintermedius]|nr:terminase small subunit [Staphylococcus pseudintermedius]MCE5607430.1 terminase small subunit [Staphylococcus pseudintermedius]MCE5609799.1 terminase small subunit [Staphylococcus pseudintermedius]MCE5614682.1 terminase small subunit [Staphylococcus pseudintermedius]MCE5709066.1 terminase small subunit [Staphylococcus pseudintermedius]
MKLTEKQQMFVDEYIIDLNATQAAIRAGYSEKCARQVGNANMSKVYIQQAIQARLAEKKDNLVMKQDEILERLTRLGRREEPDCQVVIVETPVLDKNDRVIGVEKKPQIVEVPTQNKDVIKALELLGKRYMMWNGKQAESQESKLETLIKQNRQVISDE